MTDLVCRLSGVLLPERDELVDLLVRPGQPLQLRPHRGRVRRDRAPVLLPGLVDLHTHLREPGHNRSESIRSGTRAAAAGGFTDVFAMANTQPVTDRVERVQQLRRRAATASVRVHPVAAATVELAGEQLTDVAALAAAGVTVFSDDGRCGTDEGLVHRLLESMARLGTVFAQHAQSTSIVGDGVLNAPVAHRCGAPPWPAAGEESIIARDLALSRATGGRLHVCHLTTAAGVELVSDGKRRRVPVTAEVTPHHLWLTEDDAVARGPMLKVNPPLRTEEDARALREALRRGAIDVVATDHAPHPISHKRRGWARSAFGLTALETALPLVAEVFTGRGRVDWAAVAQVMSHAPARIGGIGDRAGLAVVDGGPATFCVVQPGDPWTIRVADHYSRARNSPFDGRTVIHRVTRTFIDGRLVHSCETE